MSKNDDEAPIPFLLTNRGLGALRPDIAPADERGLAGGEGSVLSSGPTLSAEEAACELAREGRSLDDARAAVRGYQDAASERLGTSVHAWGLDEADLATIRSASSDGAPAIVPVIPLPRSSPEPSTRTGRDAGEAMRREQLALWHADDESDTTADVATRGVEL
jgi:hypothetical protein